MKKVTGTIAEQYLQGVELKKNVIVIEPTVEFIFQLQIKYQTERNKNDELIAKHSAKPLKKLKR